MIRKIISKFIQGILVLTVVYAGSFVLMEETFEKTERAEAEQEAIYIQYQTSQNQHHSTAETSVSSKFSRPENSTSHTPKNTVGSNYNIRFIYLTSFLRA